MARIRVEDVHKRFGKTIALRGVSLEVRSGEMFAILGPSGCGKTTLLRVIAGFEVPDRGHVFFDDEDVTFKPPDQRGAVMVFQNWALWPHMTVYENVAYGLKLRRLPENEIRRRVKWALELVGLEGLESRYPHQLSGGQQQRVALARALVVEPRVLLLDEPLTNLDAKLRLKLRGELRKIQRKLGITAIYVTHDQEEALAVADRIAIMREGSIEQVGTPFEVYNNPRTLFSAVFLGKTTIAVGTVEDASGERAWVRIGGQLVPGVSHGVERGERAVVVFKSEAASFRPLGEDTTCIEGVVTVSMYLGSSLEVRLVVEGYRKELIFYLPSDTSPPRVGEKVKVYLPLRAVHVFPYEEHVVRELMEQA